MGERRTVARLEVVHADGSASHFVLKNGYRHDIQSDTLVFHDERISKTPIRLTLRGVIYWTTHITEVESG